MAINNRKPNREKPIRLSLAIVISVAIAIGVLLVVTFATRAISKVMYGNKPATETGYDSASSEMQEEGETSTSLPSSTQSNEEYTNGEGDEEYYKSLSDSDFFTFNGHGAEYTFRNDSEFEVKTDEGGTLHIGKSGASVKGEQKGIIMNIHYDSPDENGIYGIQVFNNSVDRNAGFFAVSTKEGGIYRLSDFKDWEGAVEYNGENFESTDSTNTMLFWRTWDQRYNQQYKNDSDFGLIWTRDEPDAIYSGADLLIKLYNYRKSTLIGVFNAKVTYDTEAKTYYLSSLEEAPFMSGYEDEQIISASKKAVKDAALETLMKGAFYVPDKGFGEKSTDDVAVYSVNRIAWKEIATFDGDFILADNVEAKGSLVAATIKSTDASHGPITLYYGVQLSGGENGEELTAKATNVGYDLYSEKTWSAFEIRNGFNLSQQRRDASVSIKDYAPTWVTDSNVKNENGEKIDSKMDGVAELK